MIGFIEVSVSKPLTTEERVAKLEKDLERLFSHVRDIDDDINDIDEDVKKSTTNEVDKDTRIKILEDVVERQKQELIVVHNELKSVKNKLKRVKRKYKKHTVKEGV